MRKNNICFLILFFVFFIIDILIGNRTYFYFSLPFVITFGIFYTLNEYLLIGSLLVIDIFFALFIGEFTLPSLVGIYFASFISSKVRFPKVLQLSTIFSLLLLVILLISRNYKNSFNFIIESFVFSLLVSLIIWEIDTRCTKKLLVEK